MKQPPRSIQRLATLDKEVAALSDMPSLSESVHGEFGRYQVVPRPLDRHMRNRGRGWGFGLINSGRGL